MLLSIKKTIKHNFTLDMLIQVLTFSSWSQNSCLDLNVSKIKPLTMLFHCGYAIAHKLYVNNEIIKQVK